VIRLSPVALAIERAYGRTVPAATLTIATSAGSPEVSMFSIESREAMRKAQAWLAERPMLADKQLDLGLAYRTSLEALRTGLATENDLHTLAAAVNIGMVLCERGIGEEYLGVCFTAQDALMRAIGRAQATGRHGLDGPAIGELATFCELHDEQLRIATQGEVSAAVEEVVRRVKGGDVLEVRVPGLNRAQEARSEIEAPTPLAAS
jgi:hypothetical protein